MDDKSLIKDVKYNCSSESFLELKRRHMGIIMSVFHKYSNILKQINYSIFDFDQESNHILYKAISSFDLRRKIKFSSWLYSQSKYFCLNIINNSKMKFTDSDQDTLISLIDKHFNTESSKSNEEMHVFIDNILDQLSDKRMKKIFYMRYFKNNKKTTWKEIGKHFGVTSQTAINLHNKTIKLLKSKIESCAISDIV